MKKIILAAFLMLFSCKENTNPTDNTPAQNKTESTPIMQIKLPYTSDDVKKYYKADSDSTIYLVNQEKVKLNKFSSELTSLLIKENDFEIKPKSTDKYAILEAVDFSNEISCKVIIYNTFGENDSKILNIQLNSYKKNKLVDQLLLDCRFTFEIQYYRTFSINKDETIDITKYSINRLEYSENGDIIGEKKNPEINKEKVIYKIDIEGKFIKNGNR